MIEKCFSIICLIKVMNVPPFSSFVIWVLWNYSFVHFSRRQYIQHFVADFASLWKLAIWKEAKKIPNLVVREMMKKFNNMKEEAGEIRVVEEKPRKNLASQQQQQWVVLVFPLSHPLHKIQPMHFAEAPTSSSVESTFQNSIFTPQS